MNDVRSDVSVFFIYAKQKISSQVPILIGQRDGDLHPLDSPGPPDSSPKVHLQGVASGLPLASDPDAEYNLHGYLLVPPGQ